MLHTLSQLKHYHLLLVERNVIFKQLLGLLVKLISYVGFFFLKFFLWASTKEDRLSFLDFLYQKESEVSNFEMARH